MKHMPDLRHVAWSRFRVVDGVVFVDGDYPAGPVVFPPPHPASPRVRTCQPTRQNLEELANTGRAES